MGDIKPGQKYQEDGRIKNNEMKISRAIRKKTVKAKTITFLNFLFMCCFMDN